MHTNIKQSTFQKLFVMEGYSYKIFNIFLQHPIYISSNRMLTRIVKASCGPSKTLVTYKGLKLYGGRKRQHISSTREATQVHSLHSNFVYIASYNETF